MIGRVLREMSLKLVGENIEAQIIGREKISTIFTKKWCLNTLNLKKF